MSNIAAIKELREKTGLGLAECKKAIDASGSVNEALNYLREKIGKIDISNSLSGENGLISISWDMRADSIRYAIVEINTETDFAAKSQTVSDAAKEIAYQSACNGQDDKQFHTEALQNLKAQIGEEVSIGRFEVHTVGDNNSSISKYIHHDSSLGVVVVFSESVNKEVGNQVAMHIASHTPEAMCWSTEDVPQEDLDKEYVFAEKKAAGKPPQIAEKIISGFMDKYRKTVSLSEQPLVMDTSKTIGEVLGSASVVSWHRMKIGE